MDSELKKFIKYMSLISGSVLLVTCGLEVWGMIIDPIHGKRAEKQWAMEKDKRDWLAKQKR